MKSVLPWLALAGLVAWIGGAFDDEEDEKPKGNDRKKVFISFAKEDEQFRNFLVAQARNERAPFDFIDMSVKVPWNDAIWKRECRNKIRQSDGMIVLLSKNTWHAGGARWEVKCAKEERVKVVGMHVKKNDKGAIPPELQGRKVMTWSWDNLKDFTKSL